MARSNGTEIGVCARSGDVVPERCADELYDYSGLLQFQCILTEPLTLLAPAGGERNQVW